MIGDIPSFLDNDEQFLKYNDKFPKNQVIRLILQQLKNYGYK